MLHVQIPHFGGPCMSWGDGPIAVPPTLQPHTAPWSLGHGGLGRAMRPALTWRGQSSRCPLNPDLRRWRLLGDLSRYQPGWGGWG